MGTEPPEWTVPVVNIMGAYGSPPPSRHGHPPSRHGHPPSQPEQPTTVRFPDPPVRRVAIQHSRRLSVYPFLPEWPGQAAANSDRLYGCRNMVSRKKIRKNKAGGLMYAFVCPSGINCENSSHFQAFLTISQRNETF